ncbi:hypothetical protein AB0O01_17785 [Streptomyces sp. NPDC093252]|uniref:hypothetical protein n=1 Tax=Streptomyces sp. NPDC093252 TaxID=3154980 RepID=UPI003445F4C6
MHAYDVPSRPSYPSIPSGRTAPDNPGGPSPTPIYDALYAEYVKSFRTLPGDRSGEEKLGFTAFGNLPPGIGSYGLGSGLFGSSYSAYSAGANSARQGGGQPSPWQRVGQVGQQGGAVALPPAPRRGV